MYCTFCIKGKKIVYTSSYDKEKALIDEGYTSIFEANIKNMRINNSEYTIVPGRNWDGK